MVQAIGDALRVEMRRNSKVVVLGEDVGKVGGVFRVTQGLHDEFGDDRVIDTPLSELGIIGCAIGMAMYGLLPVPEIQFADFIWPSYDQIVNELSKLRYRSGNDYQAKIVIRMPVGGGIRGGHYHSQHPEAQFIPIPGLKVVCPSNPRDAKCGYDLTLTTLRIAKELAPERMTKSSIMVGMGETLAEVEEAMRDLRDAGVDVLTVGQYLRPTPKHAPLERYVEPAEFKHYEEAGAAMGFSYVASGPLVRSSYHAAEAFIAAKINGGELPGATAGAYLDTREPAPHHSVLHDSALGDSAPVQSAQTGSQLVPPSQLIRRRADVDAK
jgi:deoxyxylulose-5-phosphate synthase